MEEIKTLFSQIEEILISKRPEYHKSLAKPASSEMVQKLLMKLNIKDLPEAELFFKWHNGQKEFDSFINNCMLIKLSQAKEAYEVILENSGSSLLPILDQGSGDYICINPSNRKIEYYSGNYASSEEIAPSLTKFLRMIISAYQEAGDDADYSALFI